MVPLRGLAVLSWVALTASKVSPDVRGCSLGEGDHSYDDLPALPSAMGSHETTSSSFYVGGFQAGGNQDAYLVYPKDFATLPPASLPLVAFAHGCCKNSVNQSASDYNSVFVHLASQGMVVASFNTCLDECNMVTFSGDQIHLIAALQATPSLHPVLTQTDFQRVAILGHSMGGGSTIFSAANTDAPELDKVNVKVAVAIDPAPSVAAPRVKVPTFFACGQNDTIVPSWSVKAMYGLSPAGGQHAWADLRGAGHCAIQDPLPGSPWDFYVVQFIRCHLGMGNNTDSNEDEVEVGNKYCDEIYGSGEYSLCEAGYMVDCATK